MKVKKFLPNESYGSMLELGMFQHRMVVSTPPEKQRSPFGETVRASTGPVCALKIGLKNTTLSRQLFNKYSKHLKTGQVWYSNGRKYSGGSNTEHVRISNGRGCSVHGPDHSKTELQNGRFSLGRFIYKM